MIDLVFVIHLTLLFWLEAFLYKSLSVLFTSPPYVSGTFIKKKSFRNFISLWLTLFLKFNPWIIWFYINWGVYVNYQRLFFFDYIIYFSYKIIMCVVKQKFFKL